MDKLFRHITFAFVFIAFFLLQGFTLQETKIKVTSPKVAMVKQAAYCEGHPRKVIPFNSVNAVQIELDKYTAPEYDHNGRYEICLQIRSGDEFLNFNSSDEKLVVHNDSNRELVLGFVKANSLDNSSTPIIEVHGQHVTLFQTTFSNATVVMEGDGHKIIGATINCVANQADSLGVEGVGNNIKIKDTIINDCVNGISLSGDKNKVENVSIAFSRKASMPLAENYNLDDPNLEDSEEKEKYWADFGTWLTTNFLLDGTCLNLTGNNGVVKNVSVDQCDGISVKLSGAGHSVLKTQITGQPVPEKSGLPRHSTDCLLLQEASNVTIEGNTLSQCQKGIHCVDSQSVFIGPELFEDFGAKKNEIYLNDNAIYMKACEQAFVRHNQVYENGVDNYDDEAAYHSGLWLEDSNLGLSAPVFEPAVEGGENSLESPVVKNDENGNAFIDIKVPIQTGKIELNFSRVDFGDWERYQSSTPFSDCSFENATAIEKEGEGVEYLVRCPIQVTDEIIGKRLLAIFHAYSTGSSPLTKVLGILDIPTGIPLSGPAPTTGNMDGGAGSGSSVGSAAELIAQTQDHPGPSGGGSLASKGCGGSIVGEKTMKGFFALWSVFLVLLCLRLFHRRLKIFIS